MYGREAAERLRFVKDAQDLGLSLRAITKVLDITDAGGTPCGHMLAVVDEELAAIAFRMERLETLRGRLGALRAKVARELRRGAKGGVQGCRCVGDSGPAG